MGSGDVFKINVFFIVLMVIMAGIASLFGGVQSAVLVAITSVFWIVILEIFGYALFKTMAHYMDKEDAIKIVARINNRNKG